MNEGEKLRNKNIVLDKLKIRDSREREKERERINRTEYSVEQQ